MNIRIELNHIQTLLEIHKTEYRIFCVLVMVVALRLALSYKARQDTKHAIRNMIELARNNKFKVAVLVGMIVFLFQVHSVALSLEGIDNNLNNWDAAISE